LRQAFKIRVQPLRGLTFRASKKHKTQESTKAAKNALKLASRFQHFLNTGDATKKDLKEIDERFATQVSQQSDKILTLLDQLREVVPRNNGQEYLFRTCESWSKWVLTLDSRENLGYSNLKLGDGAADETLGVLLEGVVDSETHLFQMIFAFKSSISSALKVPESLDARSCLDFSEGAKEIMECFQSRQRMLAKIANSKH